MGHEIGETIMTEYERKLCTIRKKALRRGLRVVKFRENSASFASCGPFGISQDGILLAWGISDLTMLEEQVIA